MKNVDLLLWGLINFHLPQACVDELSMAGSVLVGIVSHIQQTKLLVCCQSGPGNNCISHRARDKTSQFVANQDPARIAKETLPLVEKIVASGRAG